MSRTTFLGSIATLVAGLLHAAAWHFKNFALAPLGPQSGFAFAGFDGQYAISKVKLANTGHQNIRVDRMNPLTAKNPPAIGVNFSDTIAAPACSAKVSTSCR
jgi:hypothetical protein